MEAVTHMNTVTQEHGNTSTTAVAHAPVLPDAVARRGLDEPQWRTLMNSLFPGAKAESVLMVVDYCKARRLDPMKKPCHIVPMKVKDAKTGEWGWRDVVMPGIYEYRTTAMRTGNYLGRSRAEYGPPIDVFGVTAPEWCEMTIYRRASNGERIEFPVRVYFREACATKFDKDAKVDVANDRWSKAPIQMLTKCAEAAGLREAFPDEFGGEPTAEEMEGRDAIDVTPATQPVRPAQRVSQQAPAAAIETVELEPEPPVTAAVDTPQHIGLITEVVEKGTGALLVLSTGYRASTRDAATIQAAAAHRDTQTLVELVCRPSSDPAKYAPIVTEIIVVESGEVGAS